MYCLPLAYIISWSKTGIPQIHHLLVSNLQLDLQAPAIIVITVLKENPAKRKSSIIKWDFYKKKMSQFFAKYAICMRKKGYKTV
jgi:hypothetical protein